VECRHDDDSAPLTVRMDRGKLRQVLLNLAQNARQAMPEGGVLTITCDQPSALEGRIRVSDVGCGIAPDRLPHIFDAFYSTREGGTGLGLAIVKRTVERAGGRVEVQSQLGRGTCFEISLPLAARAATAPASSEGATGR
jgi:signal transduction histidine kinase